MTRDVPTHCPHCGDKLKKFEMPADAGFDSPYQLACFNNDCSYYREGWDWMAEKYEVKTSYRYRVDPTTGGASPLAVWSETAIVDHIIDYDDDEDDGRNPGP